MQQAHACKDEQRRMARRARRWRVRSALTQMVSVIEAAKVNIHAALVKVTSGQLPFLGSHKSRHASGVGGGEKM